MYSYFSRECSPKGEGEKVNAISTDNKIPNCLSGDFCSAYPFRIFYSQCVCVFSDQRVRFGAMLYTPSRTPSSACHP